MKTAFLYLLVLILSFPTFAGASVMVQVEKDAVSTQASSQSKHEVHAKQPHGQNDHSMHQMQDSQEQSLSSENGMSTEHDCCADKDDSNSTQCCETGCNGCEHECSSSGFAIVSASTPLTNLANSLSTSDTRQLPVSPYLSDVIPPIS
ncbi:MAG: hypothetical protein GJ680_20385 [Alteromonadaceae bacterium]|nr:hypothetical protein [Alteromonadaceae bacterium]